METITKKKTIISGDMIEIKRNIFDNSNLTPILFLVYTVYII
jgi:hypothetical protein